MSQNLDTSSDDIAMQDIKDAEAPFQDIETLPPLPPSPHEVRTSPSQSTTPFGAESDSLGSHEKDPDSMQRMRRLLRLQQDDDTSELEAQRLEQQQIVKARGLGDDVASAIWIPLPRSPSPVDETWAIASPEDLSVDDSTSSGSSPPSPINRTSEIFRRIPRPEFPIRAYDGGPFELSWETQQRIMKWRYKWSPWEPYLSWLIEPDVTKIKNTIRPYLEQLGHPDPDIAVTFMNEGAMNKIYIVTVTDIGKPDPSDYVFRTTLPIDPYYKTESDVATTEIVRHFTDIPVPIIYAFDSSTNNPLGLEWMLMERIMGESLHDRWLGFENDHRTRISNLVATWTSQLASIQSDKIGGVFMRYNEDDTEFFVGRAQRYELIQDVRRNFDIPRGPFTNIESFYGAVLDAVDKEVDLLMDKLPSGTNEEAQVSKSPHSADDADMDSITRLGREYDEESAESRTFTYGYLRLIQNAIVILQYALQPLCDRSPEISGSLTTHLMHQDISLSNIIVNDSGNPVVLLDWEMIQMEPLSFMGPWPKFLCDDERITKPVFRQFDDEDAQGFSAEQFEEQKGFAKVRFDGDMREYIATKLRPEYLKELQWLGSPMAEVKRHDGTLYEHELHARIMNVHERAHDHPRWVKELTGCYLVFGDEDEEDEDEGEGESTGDCEEGESKQK